MNRSLTLMAAGILLVACAGMEQTGRGGPPGGDEPSRIARHLTDKLGLKKPLTDRELVFQLLAGETLGSDGDLEGAAEAYARAAMLTEDPEILRRAARIIIRAETWELGGQVADRWRGLQPDSVEALQFSALAAVQLGDVETGTGMLVELIRHSEPASLGWQRAAALLRQTDDEIAADAVMQRLLDLDDLGNVTGDRADSLFGQSLLAWQQDQLARARELAAEASRISDRVDIHEWAGQLAHADGDTEAAIGYYRKALDLEPGDKELSLAYAELLKTSGRLDEALAVLRSLERSTETLFTEASYLLEEGRREEAAELLDELAALDPTDAAGAGLQEPEPAAPDTAITDFAGLQREQEDPRSLHAFHTAQLADQLDQKERAMQWYERVDSGRYHSPARLRLAALLAEDGQMTPALEILQRMQSDDDWGAAINAYIVEANLLQEFADVDAAVTKLTAAMKAFPGNVDLTYARALAAATAGNIELAEQDLRRLIRDDPENPVYLNALGYTLTDLTDRHEEAQSLIEAALELDGEDAATLDSMGWVHYKLGHLQLAEDYLRQAWESDDNPEIGAHLGEVLWFLDKRDQALEVWRAAAAIDADHRVLRETLRRLNVEL